MFVGLILSLVVAGHFIGDGKRFASGITWFDLGTFKLQLSENIDGLTAMKGIGVSNKSSDSRGGHGPRP